MSPLVQPPARGYADWQRLNNYDEPSLSSYSGPSVPSPFITDVLDVSRFAYLGGLLNSVTVSTLVALQYWQDAAGTVGAGARQFTLSTGVGIAAQIRMPNLGPFLTVYFINIAGGNVQPLYEVFGTNRVHPLEFIPSHAVLIDQQNQPIGGAAQVLVYPYDYYAGPVDVWFSISNLNEQVALQALTVGGVWDYVNQTPPPAAVGNQFFTWVTPSGAWRFLVSNGGAAATYYLAVTPSTTGAS